MYWSVMLVVARAVSGPAPRYFAAIFGWHSHV